MGDFSSYVWQSVQSPLQYAVPVFFAVVAIEALLYTLEIREERLENRGYSAIDDGARRDSPVVLIESPHPGRWSL